MTVTNMLVSVVTALAFVGCPSVEALQYRQESPSLPSPIDDADGVGRLEGNFTRDDRHWNYTAGTEPPAACTFPVGLPVGCWLERGQGAPRILKDAFYQDDRNMTLENCASFCSNKNASLWGVEYSSECWCGNDITPGSGVPVKDISQCDWPCTGNANQTCGGDAALMIYQTLPKMPPLPPGLVVNYTYAPAGCYLEPQGSRALPDFFFSNSKTTVESCLQVCGISGYPWFGLEYSSECWCGANLSPQATLRDPSECNMPCSGNANETCGGPVRLNVYKGTRINGTSPLQARRIKSRATQVEAQATKELPLRGDCLMGC